MKKREAGRWEAQTTKDSGERMAEGSVSASPHIGIPWGLENGRELKRGRANHHGLGLLDFAASFSRQSGVGLIYAMVSSGHKRRGERGLVGRAGY